MPAASPLSPSFPCEYTPSPSRAYTLPLLPVQASEYYTNAPCPVVVHPETQHHHLAEVLQLHETLYSRPFELPASIPGSQRASPSKLMSTLGDPMEPYSEMPSELSIEGDELQASSNTQHSALTAILSSAIPLDPVDES